MNVRKAKQKLKRQYAKQSAASAELRKLAIPARLGITSKTAFPNKSRKAVKIQARPMKRVTSTPVWEQREYNDNGCFLTLRGKQATFSSGIEADLSQFGFVFNRRWVRYEPPKRENYSDC